jgi:hypothetical protein
MKLSQAGNGPGPCESRSSSQRYRRCYAIHLNMTITELRNIAEGLSKRASRVAAGRKQDSINRGWLAMERLYGYAKATMPRG